MVIIPYCAGRRWVAAGITAVPRRMHYYSVFSLLSLAQNNLEYICIAPDINQYHVVNHINGEELNQTRNRKLYKKI